MSTVNATAPGRSGNLFLDSLSSGSYARLASKLKPTAAVLGLGIAAVGKQTEHVIFPTSGVISAVTTMNDGIGVEVMLVGREGFYGLHVALGEATSPNDAMVQLPGSMLRMTSSDFADSVNEDRELGLRVLRYVQATLDSLSQLSACNRLHAIEERCARWLLMAHDRVLGDEMRLTQEYLAMMLGVRRPSVSIAASALEQAGFISYSRGRIVMRDRAGLEAAACECYVSVNASLTRSLGYSLVKASDVRDNPDDERKAAS